jgi:hypothetical protein
MSTGVTPASADAFALNAVAAGIVQELATFGGESDDLVVAVAWRTEDAARRLVADVLLGFEEFWAGDREGTKQRIVALARERMAASIADAVAHFVAPTNTFVH